MQLIKGIDNPDCHEINSTVYVTLTMTDGSTTSYSGTTDSHGQVVFSWNSATCGTYNLTVDDLILNGFIWDTTLGLISADFINC